MDTFNLNQMPPMPNRVEKKSMGPLIAVIIILVLIVVGGLYFLKERSSQPVFVPMDQADAMTESLNQQDSSDNLNSIETDLNAINLDNLDQGAAVIEAQLQ